MRTDPPVITGDQMRAVDRAMVEDFHIELVQMMENAGRNLADLARRRFDPRSAVVLAGSGGNGGGGLAAARHLANRGVDVSVVLSRPKDALSPVTAHQLDIVTRMGIVMTESPVDADADLVIDAVLGYGLSGDPTGRAAELIEWANDRTAPVLALDTPSGLDVTTGRPAEPCVRAEVTMTLALPKPGLLIAPGVVGDLFLADISVPAPLYRSMGIEAAGLFARDSIVPIRTDAPDVPADVRVHAASSVGSTNLLAPTWSTWREAIAVAGYPPHLRHTTLISAVVGTVLFCINQLDVVLQGDASMAVWAKSAVTYLVPFCVSSAGVMVATRAPRTEAVGGGQSEPPPGSRATVQR